MFKKRRDKPISKIYSSNSPNETLEIGFDIAKQFLKGENKIVLLRGGLGFGKTTLIKGIFKYFNLSEEINSPTFSIKNQYQNVIKGRNVFISHYDLYLLDVFSNEQVASIEEDLDQGIVLIEWSEKYNFKQEKNVITVNLQVKKYNKSQDDNELQIKVEVR